MMRYKFTAAVAALSMAGMASTAAEAAAPPSITYTPGVYTIPSYTTASVFENFEGGVAGTEYNAGTQSSGKFTEGTTGTVRVLQGNLPGQGFTPDGDGNKYLAVENGTFSILFGTGVQFVSFVFGTLDNYNSVQLFFADNTSQLLTGLGIINGAAANTLPGATPATIGGSGRVSYNANGGSAITRITFGSTQTAFEFDDVASAAPEPGTWLTMILGFGLIGGMLRMRRRKTTVSFA